MRNCSNAFSLPVHKRKKKIFVPQAVENFNFTTKKTQLMKNCWSAMGNKRLKDLSRGGAVTMKRTRKNILWSVMIQRATLL